MVLVQGGSSALKPPHSSSSDIRSFTFIQTHTFVFLLQNPAGVTLKKKEVITGQMDRWVSPTWRCSPDHSHRDDDEDDDFVFASGS